MTWLLAGQLGKRLPDVAQTHKDHLEGHIGYVTFKLIGEA